MRLKTFFPLWHWILSTWENPSMRYNHGGRGGISHCPLSSIKFQYHASSMKSSQVDFHLKTVLAQSFLLSYQVNHIIEIFGPLIVLILAKFCTLQCIYRDFFSIWVRWHFTLIDRQVLSCSTPSIWHHPNPCHQHQEFLCGISSKYSPYPILLNFKDETATYVCN